MLRISRMTCAMTLIFMSAVLTLPVFAESNESATKATFDSLYESISAERLQQAEINQQRETFFLKAKDAQKQALDDLKKELVDQSRLLKQHMAAVEIGKSNLDKQQQKLDERIHNIKDLFAAWKQVVKDTRTNSQSSLMSHQAPEHLASLNRLAELEKLPTSEHLAQLHTILQHDIKLSGQRTSYENEIVSLSGQTSTTTISRSGPFTAAADGHFLIYDSESNTLSEASRQPDQNFLSTLQNDSLLSVIDPSRGVLLQRLGLKPSWQDRLHQGGHIGYSIILLGVLGLLLALSRWLIILKTKRQIAAQIKSPEQIDTTNPLGKILSVYQQSLKNSEQALETESLEVRLQEIVLQEMPKLDKGLGTLKLLAAIAPLLGLLGTVVGMIVTFQTITLVGNADPQLMAGGISQALMTTVLGLVVAVPLLFAHSFVSSRSREIMIFLSQQSLGFIAQALEHDQSNQPNDSIRSLNKCG